MRNHIDYVPTWGAIQSAQDTLDKSRGNAHDIASLTIALLRASGIPARYQWGTIELPADQAMNWVGGVTKPEAALNLMYQGGIAARGFASGGTITEFRTLAEPSSAGETPQAKRSSSQPLQNQHPEERQPRQHGPLQDQQSPLPVPRLPRSDEERERDRRGQQQEQDEPAEQQHRV